MKGLRRRTKKNKPLAINNDNSSTSSTSSSSAPLVRKNKKKTKTMFKLFSGSYTQVQADPQQILGNCPQCQTGDCVIRFVAKTPHLCWVPISCCLGVYRSERVQCLQCQVVFDSPEEYRYVTANRLTNEEIPVEEEQVELVDVHAEQSPPTDLSVGFGETETLPSFTTTDAATNGANALEPPLLENPTTPTHTSKQVIPPSPPSPTSVTLLPLQQQPPPLTDEYILQELLYKGHFEQAQLAATSLLQQQQQKAHSQTNLTTLCLLDMALNGQGKTMEADRLAQTYIVPRANKGSFPRLVLQTNDYRIEAKQYFAPRNAHYLFQVYYTNNSTSSSIQRRRTFELQRQGSLMILRECFSGSNRTMDIVSGGAHPIPSVTRVAKDVMDYLALELCFETTPSTAREVERTVPVVV